MHIEPGLISPAKMILSYATAAGAGAFWLKTAAAGLKEKGLASLAARGAMATAAVFTFFQVLPHYPVGISEVHFILGSTLFLLLGAAPAAFGLAFGLLLQGLFFAPFDLPQYGANVTTLLVPLFALKALADTLIPRATAYVDIRYRDALALSTAYQGGVVLWVAFWAFYGQGFSATTAASVFSFGGAYMLVVLVEPLADLAVLAAAKSLKGLRGSGLTTPRLYDAA
ncbi:energy-coupling factor ABC transporter permease [Pseudooceanicola sp. CBS1P-1]|uniref:Cobalt transporter n=1 Tax=Pseudooceanicola albus TaxID=2692189 RepID=A0A6L7G4K1_9RHOB|nr:MULTISPECIES: energy-coupling factor ABC transporter permease [Pseudooceanicola]MBT9384737.1 energy-coupling factor ABC transporter permease [Pseudooceanicola endophyticus]MXN18438.1 cobalt transporter [Pseudooceanicola albus]